MWKIEINGQAVIFKGKVAMTEYSPIFYDIVNNSLPFTLKDDDAGINRRALGYLNKPEISDNSIKESPCTIYNGMSIIPGTVTSKWQNNDFSCYFKDTGSFWAVIKDKLLSDISFDKVVLGMNYAEIAQYCADINASIDNQFAFPEVVIGETSPIDLGVKINFYSINPNVSDPLPNIIPPIIPFLYLKYIYSQIFEKNGIAIIENDLANDSDLCRLIFANNYLLNEFVIDTTEISTTNYIIGTITNSTDPQVSTLKPHNLQNYQLIKMDHLPDGPPVSKRIFQIELIDAYNFKLIGEDFSNYNLYDRLYSYVPEGMHSKYMFHDITIEYSYNCQITIQVNKELPYDTPEYYFFIYMVSDDYEGFAIASTRNAIGMPLDRTQIVVYPHDPDAATHNYNNFKCVIVTADVSVINNVDMSVSNVQTEGTLIELEGLQSNFNEIDPKNHVPSIKIYDFLKECFKTFGIVPFVQGNSVKIKLFKNILTDKNVVDISSHTALIKDIENPAISGYKLSFKDDSNDKFWSDQVKVHKIETKYTICASVQTKNNLPVIGSNTNDVRLVIGENAWYVFNKSFLNTDNNWKFLSYNLLDAISEDGGLVKDSQFSPILSGLTGLNADLYYMPKMDIPFACKNFPSDKQMAPRLLYYQGLKTVGAFPLTFNIYYASGDIYPFTGHGSPAADLSIRWDTEWGLINKFLKEELHWQLTIRKDCISMSYWPNKLHANFDYSKKYRCRGVDNIVKSRKYTLDFETEQVEYNETELAKV